MSDDTKEDLTRHQVMQDFGEWTVVKDKIEKGTKERSRIIRNLARFVFRHSAWTKDREWVRESRTALSTVELYLTLDTAQIEVPDTQHPPVYFDVAREMAGGQELKARYLSEIYPTSA